MKYNEKKKNWVTFICNVTMVVPHEVLTAFKFTPPNSLVNLAGVNTLKNSTDPSLFLAKCLALFLADVKDGGWKSEEKEKPE